ncbi:MAG: DUF2059 domain-containing protein [Brevundimonas sp.]|uniref:DUF2059 domain-containing protein n=1 Tax=Brevundimonas sp. TaxID=1871086 RepID=UPI00120D2734|nr:DUF2059 domain-containing protein [Brevundimonas sp.]RZJ16567.1 MAG: DUF2059 domain-containing protein [Brevundimonas sp.]
MRIVLAAVAAMVMCATSGVAARAHAQEVETAQPSDSADVAKKTELIRRYLVAIQYEKLVNTMIESMSGQLLARSRIPEEKRGIARDALIAAYDVVLPQMQEATIELYVEIFTIDELEQMVAFYESAVGRSIMAKTVMLSQRSGDLMQEFAPLMEREMTSQLCRRLDCEALGLRTAQPPKR